MPQTSTSPNPGKGLPLVPGAVLLAFVLVASLWAATYFGTEARMRRATARVMRLVQKEGPDSPVALGLSANRLGNQLATNAVLELEGYGVLATGRPEIVQLYANVRNSLDEIAFENPRISAIAARRGDVRAIVDARYRLAGAGEAQTGVGKAALQWVKGADGWQIARAKLTPDPASAGKRSWP